MGGVVSGEPRHRQPGKKHQREPVSEHRSHGRVATASACCSCAAGIAGPRRLAAKPSSPSSVNSRLLLRPSCSRLRRAGIARAAGGGGGGEGDGGKSGAAAFFGEDGVVEDMDGYMDYLSLEYDSVWDTKPVWSVPLLLFVVLVSLH
ncbi:hypothetical protein PR202_ga13136 [Eleusine coracana subsp. coracana]|uniref:Uncharacterized protein n=1 Tax=Eleusine coracana subsp. coracana TaxID=191504 RepID=A0AAV5CDK2_ELECO|nr:hypothetical protein PR202_ga13136 [Eleusine coracana subsp. coracana]